MTGDPPGLSPSSPLPVDPFTEGDAAEFALGELWDSILRSRIPLASAERIIGVMFAEMPAPGQVYRILLARLEGILADEGVPADVAARVIRRMEAPGG
jgi:hypothetical protein